MKRIPRRSSLSDLQSELNQLFDLNWFNNGNLTSSLREADWVPPINVKERQNDYLIFAELPGIDKKNVEISIENNMLTIQGKREEHKEEKDEKFLRVESTSGSFMRRISLPDSVDTEKASADFKNGMLEIILPKSKANGAKSIKIRD